MKTLKYLKKHWSNILGLLLIILISIFLVINIWMAAEVAAETYGCVKEDSQIYYTNNVDLIPQTISGYGCVGDNCERYSYRLCEEYGDYFSWWAFLYLLIEPFCYLGLAWIVFSLAYIFEKMKKGKARRKMVIRLLLLALVVVLVLIEYDTNVFSNGWISLKYLLGCWD